VACPGVHGANRLASNSLLDTLVFSHRLVASTLGQQVTPPEQVDDRNLVVTLQPKPLACVPGPALSLPALQDLMWRNLGISRHGSQLIWASRTLYRWERTTLPPTDRASHELRNMVLLGRLMAEAALLRQESRGSHFRADFPQTSANWEKHVVLVKEEDVE
jgi:L-aspartate oxidase